MHRVIFLFVGGPNNYAMFADFAAMSKFYMSDSDCEAKAFNATNLDIDSMSDAIIFGGQGFRYGRKKCTRTLNHYNLTSSLSKLLGSILNIPLLKQSGLHFKLVQRRIL